MFSTWRLIEKIVPLIQWSKRYDVNTAISDLIAGITIGLTLIPQVIAYASLAGLEPQYGLYSSLCGGFIYAMFGTTAELNIAPTALLSLLTYTYSHNSSFGNVRAAILLTFLAGILELLCGVLHLGFLVDFVSVPVVSAFTSAGAITIASSQVKNLFGFRFNAESFVDVWKNVFTHLTELRLWDTLLGFICILVLLAMRKLKDYGIAPTSNDPQAKAPPLYRKFIWFASVGRNAFVVLSCAVLAFVLKAHQKAPFSLTSQVPSGLPAVSFPLHPIHPSNGTNGTTVVEMISELGYGIVVIPFVAVIANVGIAKAFAHGKVLDASQEMIAVGLCNIVGAFVGSYPVNASFSRAAVSSASGVRTPLAGLYTGVMVIMALTLLTPYFSYIPKPTLAAVIICAVIFMVEVAITKLIWKLNKIDLVPFFITFVSCLLIGIELGILIGVLVELIKTLYYSARPKILTEKVSNAKSYLNVILTASVFFSSAEYIRDRILQQCVDLESNFHTVLIDCTRIYQIDFTGGKCLGALATDLQKTGKKVAFLAPGRFQDMLHNICGPQVLIFKSINEFEDYFSDKQVSNGSVEAVTTQL